MPKFNSKTGKKAGRLGGIAAAARGPEFRAQRASAGGTVCRTKYGQHFYRHIRSKKS